jgi:hypothetical protein
MPANGSTTSGGCAPSALSALGAEDFNATRDHRPFRELLAAGLLDYAGASRNGSRPSLAVITYPAPGSCAGLPAAIVPMTRTIRFPVPTTTGSGRHRIHTRT